MTTYETMLVEISDEVATVTLNRPKRLNAFDRLMSQEFAQVIRALDADDDVRVIVITGAGRVFCAGVDVESGLPRDDEERPHWRTGETVATLQPWRLRTPLIAAINGDAVGLGLTLPMLWDIRVAAEDAKLGFVFNRRGFLPEANSMWLLSRLVGAATALELLLTARTFSGQEAAQMGLVTRAVPRGQVLPTALEIARDIAVNTAPLSTAITKRLFWAQLESNDRLASRAEELDFVRWVIEQPDFKEGMSAFLEKRQPRWTGKRIEDLPAGLP
jgi:enoyl-CoA hydratase/carnithine racemase